MTLQECTAILTPFALAMQADMDKPKFRAYHRVLESIPAPLLEAALEKASRQERRFGNFPGANELAALAERERLALRAAAKFDGCEACNGSGWASILVDGVSRVTRCACWKAHQARLEQLGAGTEPLALPPTRELVVMGGDE